MSAENNIIFVPKSHPIFSMEQLSPSATILCLILSIFHLLLNAVCLPISAINFTMILRTTIIHRNLKCLLLLQSFTISCFSASELARTIQKFATFDFFLWNPLACWLLSATLISMLFIDSLSFGLLAERIYATIKPKSYERAKGAHFIAAIFIILCFATFVCFYTGVDFGQQSGVPPSLYTLVQVYSCLALNFLSIIAGFVLWKYNKQKYAKLLNAHCSQNYGEQLSLKYQLSENIRTNRQLLPSAIFHFANVFLTISFALQAHYGISTQNAGWSVLCMIVIFLLFSLFNIAIQISIIMMHPILWRKVVNFIFSLQKKFRRHRVGNSENMINQQRPPMDIFGNELFSRNPRQMEEHFQVLERFWN